MPSKAPQKKRTAGKTGSVTKNVQSMRTRAIANRIQNQEDLRNRIANTKLMNDVEALLKDVANINKLLNSRKRKNITTEEKNFFSIKLDALKISINIKFKLLAKVLPDLKSVELSDPNGNNPFAEFVEMITKATKDTMK